MSASYTPSFPDPWPSANLCCLCYLKGGAPDSGKTCGAGFPGSFVWKDCRFPRPNEPTGSGGLLLLQLDLPLLLPEPLEDARVRGRGHAMDRLGRDPAIGRGPGPASRLCLHFKPRGIHGPRWVSIGIFGGVQ